jgi:hypothetical protein
MRKNQFWVSSGVISIPFSASSEPPITLFSNWSIVQSAISAGEKSLKSARSNIRPKFIAFRAIPSRLPFFHDPFQWDRSIPLAVTGARSRATRRMIRRVASSVSASIAGTSPMGISGLSRDRTAKNRMTMPSAVVSFARDSGEPNSGVDSKSASPFGDEGNPSTPPWVANTSVSILSAGPAGPTVPISRPSGEPARYPKIIPIIRRLGGEMQKKRSPTTMIVGDAVARRIFMSGNPKGYLAGWIPVGPGGPSARLERYR